MKRSTWDKEIFSIFSRMVVATMLMMASSPAWASGSPPIFPTPAKVAFQEGHLNCRETTVIVTPAESAELADVADFLAGELGSFLGATGGKLAVVAESAWQTKEDPAVVLGCADNGSLATARIGTAAEDLPQKPGAYVLTVGSSGATVLGRDAQGVYFGSLSLLQLLSRDGGGQLACATVVDYPFHFYRGMRVAPPRGKPREGEISLEYFRNFIRLLSFLKLNHVWFQGTSWGLPLRRHPEMAWKDVLTLKQTKDLDEFGSRHFLSMDGSLDWGWLNYDYKHLVELYPDETWEKMRPEVKKKSRLNPCPSNPETWKILYETMDDVMEVLSGDHFAIPLDEMYQESRGSRWAVCPLCRDKDPVRLWADFANRLAAHVIEKGRIPIMSGGMLLREHQGWYKNIYQAIDMIDSRDKIVIYNWSEGHIRRGGMKVGGKRLRNPDMKTTPFFRRHGYKDVMHLLMGRWQGRPELREVSGKLDCYGGFVSYYHSMDYETFKARGTLESLLFSAQHLWSPDKPRMNSTEDFRLIRYGEVLAAGVLHGKSFTEAVELAREVDRKPQDLSDDKAVPSRLFESLTPQLDLTGIGPGNRFSGEMPIYLPVEEANPHKAYLLFTLNGWKNEKDVDVRLNGRMVDLKAAKKWECGDGHCFQIEVPAEWLNFGSASNVLRFTRRSSDGFKVVKAAIGVSEH